MTITSLMAVALLGAAPVNAQDPGTVVGAKVSAAIGGGGVGFTPGFAIDVRRGFLLDGRLGLGLEVGFSSSVLRGTFSGGPVPADLGYRTTLLSTPAVLSAVFAQPVSDALTVYGSAGFAAAWLRGTSAAGGGTNVENDRALGFDVTAGGEYGLGPGRLAVELGYRYLRTKMDISGAGNLLGPAVRVGYRLRF